MFPQVHKLLPGIEPSIEYDIVHESRTQYVPGICYGTSLYVSIGPVLIIKAPPYG